MQLQHLLQHPHQHLTKKIKFINLKIIKKIKKKNIIKKNGGI